MIIKKFLAKTEQDAIEMAKKELGNNAVVMNIKKVHPKGIAKLFIRPKVEVTAALDEVQNYPPEQPAKKESAAAKPEKKKTPAFVPVHKEEEDDNSLLDKLEKLERLLEIQTKEKEEKREPVSQNAVPSGADRPKPVEDPEEKKAAACKDLIHAQLMTNGVDKEIADSIMEEVNKSLPRHANLDQILASVYQKIILMMGQPYLINVPEKGEKTKYIFFLGSTGVGKTTTIAKIASMLKLEKKANIALVTADTYRIAAVEQLKTYANILSVPLRIIYSAGELKDSLDELNQYDLCLIDTAGRSHKNKEQIQDIRELIEQIPIADRQVYLVLNAGSQYNDLQEIAKVYSSLTDFSIIFTKLDETSSAGAVLNMHVKTKCPLSYVTWGQNVPEDIGEFNAQTVAKKLLGDNLRNKSLDGDGEDGAEWIRQRD